MKKILLFLIVSFPFLSFSQVERDIDSDFDNMFEILEDEMAIQEEGAFTLRFADAETDKAVQNATISIKNIGTYTTDVEGLVRFPLQADGKYHFSFEKDGYIPADMTFEVVAGMIYFNRFSVSKKMDLGQIRIVLDWGNSPNDLDLHLEKVGQYHIAYHHKKVADDQSARLDRDDVDGNGPETITITDVDDNATYNCYVHDFTNRDNTGSKKLSKSKARISVYNNNQLEFVLDIPVDELGTRWDAFQLNKSIFNKLNRLAN